MGNLIISIHIYGTNSSHNILKFGKFFPNLVNSFYLFIAEYEKLDHLLH